MGCWFIDIELVMYLVMWSEYCLYKFFKVYLCYFGEIIFDEMCVVMLVGIGENVGVVDIGDGWVVIFKVELYNYLFYVEFY